MPERPSLFEAQRNRFRGPTATAVGPVAQALLAASLVACLKAVVEAKGWEVPGMSVSVLTALLGAVVFALAIIFAGVLADFKEAERGLGEMVSAIRRLHWDFATSGLDAAGVRQARAHLGAFLHMVLENARDGFRWRLRDLHGPIDAMDKLLLDGMEKPLPTTRTTQVGLATLTRTVDRLETIVETTFMQAGYLFSACAIGLLLACLLITPLGGGFIGPVLIAAVTFLLVGLYLLVRDLDNPLAGSVRISVSQVEKLATYLRERDAGTESPRTEVVAASPSHAKA